MVAGCADDVPLAARYGCVHAARVVSVLGKSVATVTFGGKTIVWRTFAKLPSSCSEAARWPAAPSHIQPVFSPWGLSLYYLNFYPWIESPVIEACESIVFRPRISHDEWQNRVSFRSLTTANAHRPLGVRPSCHLKPQPSPTLSNWLSPLCG